MKKRLWSFLLALCMALTLLPFGALAAKDPTAYIPRIREVIKRSSETAYGTFFDLNQDGSPELIITEVSENHTSGTVNIVSAATPLLSQSIQCGDSRDDHSQACAIIVKFKDGAYGLLLHDVTYGDYAGTDADGYPYYWTHTSDQIYKAEENDLVEVTSGHSTLMETKPDKNGSYRYSKEDMSFFLWIGMRGRSVVEAEYDLWYQKNINTLEPLMTLSPFRQLDGIPGPELLAFLQTGFRDVPESQYYAEPVMWAAAQGITNGTAEAVFSPGEACTRGQVVTFLWRAAGEPKPERAENPFKDVKKGAYYYDAVLWAVEQGITNGTSETTFSPGEACTRGQVVTFLYRNAGTPAVKAKNPFKDVKKSAYYYDAVLWAVKNEITNGTSETAFSPDNTCTRGQIVTFLYRGLAEK